MHAVPAKSSPEFADPAPILEKRLDFLWLELTNRCNLQCVHCYTESSPHSGDRDRLTKADYVSIMVQARALGCEKMQFIGGEPQLNRDFQELLVEAKNLGFEFIEVYTNLTRLSDETLRYAADNGICFATSVYSDVAEQHDAITKVRSSHTRTIGNLRKLIGAGIETRAAIIAIDQDRATIGRTSRYLKDMGVGSVGSGETREFGRGEQVLSQEAKLSGLCGHCWAGKLCIAPDGAAYPCVMARQWPVGNVLEHSLAEIVRDRPLQQIRQTIFDTVWMPRIAPAMARSRRAASNSACPPENPSCGPDIGAPDCAPELNPPLPEGDPGAGEDQPQPECFPCPQSCNPDWQVPPCEPSPCPQSGPGFPTGTPQEEGPGEDTPEGEGQREEREKVSEDDQILEEAGCWPCPQSCDPNWKMPPCSPTPCPQSCWPYPA